MASQWLCSINQQGLLDAKPYANHDAFQDAALTAGVFSSIYYHYMFSENLWRCMFDKRFQLSGFKFPRKADMVFEVMKHTCVVSVLELQYHRSSTEFKGGCWGPVNPKLRYQLHWRGIQSWRIAREFQFSKDVIYPLRCNISSLILLSFGPILHVEALLYYTKTAAIVLLGLCRNGTTSMNFKFMLDCTDYDICSCLHWPKLWSKIHFNREYSLKIQYFPSQILLSEENIYWKF